MSLLGAIDLLINARFQTDADMQGHKLLNLDTSNLSGLGEFGPQAPHTIFAGPDNDGQNAPPSFRIYTPAELGAQPHGVGLDALSSVVPTVAGISLLQFPNPTGGGYVKNVGNLDVPNYSWALLTPTQLRTDIAAQPLAAGLTTLSTLTPTQTGQNFLTLTNPVSAGYPKINNDVDHTISVLTPAQLIADLGVIGAPFVDTTAIIKGSADATKLLRIEVDGFTTGTTRVMTPPNYNFTPASLIGEEALLNKKVNGLLVAVGTSPSPDSGTAITYTPETAYAFTLSMVSIGYNGGSIVLRTTAPTDVLLPVSGVLATVAGTIPASYLSADKELGGLLASDLKVATQKAAKLYVDARTGTRIPPISDDTVDSDTTVDLTGLAYQLEVLGTTTIEAFTMNEGDGHILVFEGELTLVNSASLVLPDGKDIITAAGDYAMVYGLSGGVTKVEIFKAELGQVVAFSRGIFSGELTSGPFNATRIARATIYASSIATLDSNVLTGGGTDVTVELNAALTTLGTIGGGKLILDGPALISASLSVPSGVTIECPNDKCGVYLASGSHCHMVKNAKFNGVNYVMPPAAIDRDSDITIIGGTWNGNQANQSKWAQGNPANTSWVCGFQFSGIDRLRFKDVTILNAKTFAYFVMYPDNLDVIDCTSRWDTFNIATSQDGLHLWGPARGTVYVRNYRHINGSDDAIALNYCESQDPSLGFTIWPAAGAAAVNTVVDGVYQENGAQTLRIDARYADIGNVTMRNVYATYNDTYHLNNSVNAQGKWQRLNLENWVTIYNNAAANDTKNILCEPTDSNCVIDIKNWKVYYHSASSDTPLQGGSFFKYGAASTGARHILLENITYHRNLPVLNGGLFYLIQNGVAPTEVRIINCEIIGCYYLYVSEALQLSRLFLSSNRLNGATTFHPSAGVEPLVTENVLTDGTVTWNALTLVNSWVNWNAGTHATAAYRKELGRVWMRGLIKSGTTTFGTTITTIPAGFRPSKTNIFSCASSSDGTVGIVGVVQIASTGEVQILSGGNSYLTLNLTWATE